MKMVLKRACSLAMRISKALQRPKPPPTVTPFTAAMVGFSAPQMLSTVRTHFPDGVDRAAAARVGSGSPLPMEMRSAPAHHARPSPVTTKARTRSSRRPCSKAALSSERSVPPSEFMRSGRFRRMSITPSVVSTMQSGTVTSCADGWRILAGEGGLGTRGELPLQLCNRLTATSRLGRRTPRNANCRVRDTHHSRFGTCTSAAAVDDKSHDAH